MPQVWATEGYTYPAEVAAEIDTHVGPFLQNPARDALGLVDDETFFELVDMHHDCLADVAHHLCATRDWDVLFTEVHSLDYGNHFFMAQTDPRCGASESVVARSREGMTRIIASVDRWVGRLLELQDSETVVVVTSDHGGTPDFVPPIAAADVLEEVGLLVTDPATGEIDLSKSAAIPVGTIHVFINLKGRDPGGIVEPEDFEKEQQQVIHALTTYIDPGTGKQPFALAVTRENAEMLNLWGDLVGDVVWAVHPEFDACHGRHLPAVSLGIGGQHTTFIVNGPNIRNGSALQGQARSVDIAPTLAYLLGVPQPRDAEGRVIMEAIEA
jgi:predicted AlkP superfamily phosphohydrolase/phosphomutase